MEIKIELNHNSKKQKNLEQYFLWLLANKDYFTVQLKKKALEKGYALEEIERVLQKLLQNSYLDDERLLERVIQSYQARGKSNREIWAKLASYGLDRQKISAALHEEKDQKALKKHLGKIPADLSYQQKQKIVAKLLRKGFGLSEILAELA